MHHYPDPGTYIATLTVTGGDDSVTTASATSSIINASLPFARTRKPAQILDTQAALAGNVDANAPTAEWWFEWGPTPALGNSTPHRAVPLGETSTAEITGLTPGTNYYFRIVAENEVGTTTALTARFTTKP